MNKPLKYILLSICGGILALCIVCSYVSGNKLRRDCVCKRLEVKVLDSLQNQFVTAADIKKVLDKTYGEYIGVKTDSLDLVIELRTAMGAELVSQVMALEGINSVSLLSHDGEVTF